MEHDTADTVLVGCEVTGAVRDAFLAQDIPAVSCDLAPTEVEGPHIQGDLAPLLKLSWGMIIAFPPCTHLAASGAVWFKYKQYEQADALDFVRKILNANSKHIAMENPIGIISTRIRKPTQIIEPWMFGHNYKKKTCLWLKGLPPLQPTCIAPYRLAWCNRLPQTKDRASIRSRTFTGVASAMATQWGPLMKGNR